MQYLTNFRVFKGPPGITGMDGFDGQKGLLGDHGDDCKFCPDGNELFSALKSNRLPIKVKATE